MKDELEKSLDKACLDVVKVGPDTICRVVRLNDNGPLGLIFRIKGMSCGHKEHVEIGASYWRGFLIWDAESCEGLAEKFVAMARELRKQAPAVGELVN